MFSLQTMFGSKDKVFPLLKAASAAACQASHAADRLARHEGEAQLLMATLRAARREEKLVAGKVSEELINTFVTTLDREDIEAINAGLYRIPKTVEKFAERHAQVAARLDGVDFSRRTAILAMCTDVVAEMVGEMCNGLRIAPMRKLQNRLQALEAEADKLLLEPYSDLYLHASDPLRVMLVKDLFETLEDAVDMCRDVGNVIYSVVLKNN